MPEPRGQRLWAVLLVVDSFFVIIFGGALGAKLYQHWSAPAAPAAPARSRRPPKATPQETPKTAAEPAAPAPAPVAEQAKPAAPKPAQGKVIDIPRSADAPRPPKPSLLHEAPVRQAASPQGGSPAAAPAGAPSAAPKAVPVQFQVKSPGARSVELAGAFIVRGGKKPMSALPDGTWTITVYLTPNTYRYWFLVNGRKTLDPQNPNTERGASVISVAPSR